MFLHVIDRSDAPDIYLAKSASLPLNDPKNHTINVRSNVPLQLNTTYSFIPKRSWCNSYFQSGLVHAEYRE